MNELVPRPSALPSSASGRRMVLATIAAGGGRAPGIKTPIGYHTFRANGITAYLEIGGALAHAQAMAAPESPRTTKLYDRTKERLTFDEIERIML